MSRWMALSLRRRFVLATTVLAATELLTAGFALASWRAAIASADRQQDIAEARIEVAGLGSAVREQYVHQAHTYIEGGSGHLHHGSEAATEVRRRLDRLDAMELTPVEDQLLADIRADQGALEAWFDDRVAPLAAAGTLDRARATELHAGTESLTRETTNRIDTLLADLDAVGRAEQGRAATAYTGAVGATLLVAGVGLLVVLFIGRSLANAVLAPVDAIRDAAAAWRHGAKPEGADELGEIAVGFDAIVTRLSEAEAQRLESARLVALGEMSAAVAHELMNPLAVILGETSTPDCDPAAIRAEAEHARRIVEGLLGFARPIEQPAARIDVAEAARQAVDRAVALGDARDVSVTLTTDGPAWLVASPSGVRQILDNLVKNAIEASADGGAVEVAVRAAPFEVVVRDRGAGLPDAVRKRLYEPFVTGKPTGTGLGLAVCQRIARSLGSTIEHRDREGGGTVARWALA